MNKILVLGGTGFIGQSLCEQLVTRFGGAGPRIEVPTRQIQRGRRVQYLPTVDVIAADVNRDEDLRRVVAGSDVVVNLIARLHGSQAEFDRTHVDLPRRLAQACRANGVRRVVHVSALGAAAGAPSMYQRTKAGGEAVLATSGLDVTVLRPAVVFGPLDHFMNLFARLQAVLPVMPLAGASCRLQPVWVTDVADALVAAIERRDTIGQVYELAGPKTYTLAELVRLAGRWSGHERPVFGLPGPLAKLQALAMECLPGEPMISRDNVDSLKTDNVATGRVPGLAALGITPSALESVMPMLLARRDSVARLDTWRRGAGR
ncbi:complex I NDUFA9 subunit family protein [Rhizobacter sp. Root1221]|uniref:complex I NDUFA9 subunit family protein n=1 Tax=Rhizobacter sp. Root1221 TaxID=1736433 RepID=UPI0006FB070D|nr:complex I NDUFA9 subunit family protein [Rhizobacter sp. Root1221]KQV91545.1 NAD-dependent dehydratase [Rhizobacter sp. Root1221]